MLENGNRLTQLMHSMNIRRATLADCVEIAKDAGITAVVQPGGSIKDQESIDYCDANDIAMVTTGIRHFRH